MTLDPWIIEQLEEEERRRREDEDAQRHRIELPQTRPAGRPAEHGDKPEKPREAEPPRVQIVDISPPSENCIDL